MRRSYQGHIKDLPGKNIIKPDSVIREILRVPESEADTFVGPKNIRKLERETLEGFGVMPGVIPDVCFRALYSSRAGCLWFSSILVY